MQHMRVLFNTLAVQSVFSYKVNFSETRVLDSSYLFSGGSRRTIGERLALIMACMMEVSKLNGYII